MFRGRQRRLDYIGRACRRNCGSWGFGSRGGKWWGKKNSGEWRVALRGSGQASGEQETANRRVCVGRRGEFAVWGGQGTGAVGREDDAGAHVRVGAKRGRERARRWRAVKI